MTNDKPLVIYHANCWDGFCAAWVVRKALGEIEAVPAYYGASAPDVSERNVYIVDFSYPAGVLRQMADDANTLVVLDHHKTAAAELTAANVTHEFDINKSGGRLAWEWFNSQKTEAPWLVAYTEDRDLWWHLLPESENINAALRSYPLDFALWDEFDQAMGQREIFKREGSAIRRAERAIIQSHVNNAKEIELDGHRILSVNATVLFSEIAGELAKDRPFGACYFDRQDGKRQWSLRSTADGIDVSAIAKAHGGGGHRQAAGFEVTL